MESTDYSASVTIDAKTKLKKDDKNNNKDYVSDADDSRDGDMRNNNNNTISQGSNEDDDANTGANIDIAVHDETELKCASNSTNQQQQQRDEREGNQKEDEETSPSPAAAAAATRGAGAIDEGEVNEIDNTPSGADELGNDANDLEDTTDNRSTMKVDVANGGNGDGDGGRSIIGLNDVKLFVDRIPTELDEAAVKKLFCGIGIGSDDVRVDLLNDPKGVSRGCAYVYVRDDAAAEQAIQKLDGDASKYQLRVKVAVVHLDGRHRLAGTSPSSAASSRASLSQRDGGDGVGSAGSRLLSRLRLGERQGDSISTSRSNSAAVARNRPTSAKGSFKLFVANLPRQFTEEQVAELFSPFGTILDIYILRHYDTRASKGLCLVTFERKSDAHRCIADMDNSITLPGVSKRIAVSLAKTEKELRNKNNNSNNNPNHPNHSTHHLHQPSAPRFTHGGAYGGQYRADRGGPGMDRERERGYNIHNSNNRGHIPPPPVDDLRARLRPRSRGGGRRSRDSRAASSSFSNARTARERFESENENGRERERDTGDGNGYGYTGSRRGSEREEGGRRGGGVGDYHDNRVASIRGRGRGGGGGRHHDDRNEGRQSYHVNAGTFALRGINSSRGGDRDRDGRDKNRYEDNARGAAAGRYDRGSSNTSGHAATTSRQRDIGRQHRDSSMNANTRDGGSGNSPSTNGRRQYADQQRHQRQRSIEPSVAVGAGSGSGTSDSKGRGRSRTRSQQRDRDDDVVKVEVDTDKQQHREEEEADGVEEIKSREREHHHHHHKPITSYAPPPSAIETRKQTRLMVLHLPLDCESDHLFQVFDYYGTTISANIIRDRNTGKSTGRACVCYGSLEEARTAQSALDNNYVMPGGSKKLAVSLMKDNERVDTNNNTNNNNNNNKSDDRDMRTHQSRINGHSSSNNNSSSMNGHIDSAMSPRDSESGNRGRAAVDEGRGGRTGDRDLSVAVAASGGGTDETEEGRGRCDHVDVDSVSGFAVGGNGSGSGRKGGGNRSDDDSGHHRQHNKRPASAMTRDSHQPRNKMRDDRNENKTSGMDNEDEANIVNDTNGRERMDDSYEKQKEEKDRRATSSAAAAASTSKTFRRGGRSASPGPPRRRYESDDNAGEAGSVSSSSRLQHKKARTSNSDEFKLYVSGIPYSTTDEQIRGLFNEYGKVTSAHVMKDQTGRSKGSGFITYGLVGEAEASIDGLNGSFCMDKVRALRVDFARPKGSIRVSRRGGRGGGRGSGGRNNNINNNSYHSSGSRGYLSRSSRVVYG